VAPEAAVGGPIALVKDGDRISVDLFKKKVDLQVNASTLATRKKNWKPLKKQLTGILSRYAKTVEQAHLGAVQR
jgi:dihydroxy-acid dehydratase